MPHSFDVDKFEVNSTNAMLNALFIFIVTKCHCRVKMYGNSKVYQSYIDKASEKG